MNRYESAYRDYTVQRTPGPDDYPQRPERTKGRTRVVVQPKDSSDSSAESYDQRPVFQQPRGFNTDDDGFVHQQGPPHQHHQISSRELSDRSGERSNPDFIVTNGAMQQAYQRSPSMGSGDSMSDDSEGRRRAHHHQMMLQQEEDEQRFYNESYQPDDVGGVPEIYIPQPELLTRMPTSELSQGSYRTYRTAPPYTEDVTARSKTSKRGGIVIETSRAPHPMCPNTRSCCCLMLLFNLGLLLVCLGFVIVLQLNDPPFVWYLGVFMLVFGFVSLVIGLIFCAWMCREGSPDAPIPPNSELYWTHHWRKTIYLPESHGRIHETHVKTPIGEEVHYLDESDSYSGGQQVPPQQRYQQQHNGGRY